jgi:hypothetical protein
MFVTKILILTIYYKNKFRRMYLSLSESRHWQKPEEKGPTDSKSFDKCPSPFQKEGPGVSLRRGGRQLPRVSTNVPLPFRKQALE